MSHQPLQLGIEIGGTKLQLGVGAGADESLVALRRCDVTPSNGAGGIRAQIEQVGAELLAEHRVERIGFGFGGPVVTATGTVIKSHQIDGWDAFPLGQWCRETLGCETIVGNDCNVAALAEARVGAGQGRRGVFYVTVGTGVGGGLAVDGKPYGGHRPAVAEIGHLRPGVDAIERDATVESVASGWGIVAGARRQIEKCRQGHTAQVDDLLSACEHDVDRLTGKMVAEAAARGNGLAQTVLDRAVQTLGWAVAQTITLTAVDIVVIGGGVSLMGQQQFFAPLREQVARYIFPPLADSYEIVPASLGELAVVHGAIALAAG